MKSTIVNRSVRRLTLEELEAGLPFIRQAPTARGSLDRIVRRPRIEEREAIERGALDRVEGLVGDNWRVRGSRHMKDGSAHPGRQITLVSSRVIDLVAQERERWDLAGDQLYVDLDLSADNLPPGTRLEIGTAVLEVTAESHTGCKKFAHRYGLDALRFVSTPLARELNLRGIYAQVVQPGRVHVGDAVVVRRG